MVLFHNPVQHSILSKLGFYLSTLILGLFASQSAFAGSLLINWNPISSSTLAGYKIKSGTTSGTYSQSVSVGKVTSYASPNLTDGVKYYFVIAGVDANSVEGTPSAEVSGVVLNSASIAVGSITTFSAIVAWTTNKPGSSQIEYGTTSSYGSTTPLDSTLVANHSQTLTNLNGGTTYNYRIRSVDLGGSVHVSANLTFTTGAASLTSSNVAVGSITTSSAVITWTTNSPSNSQVEYGTTTSYGSMSALDSTLVVNHSQTLTKLNPGAIYNYRIRSTDAGGSVHVSANFTFTTAAALTSVSVNAGGGIVSQFGADTGFSGGSVASNPLPVDLTGVTNPAPEAVYQSERWGTSFSYTFSNLTASNAYYVRLHFSEDNWTNVGQRRFHVAINGVQVLTDFDILAAAGKQHKASIQQFRAVASSSGQIVIQYLQGSADSPSTNGIELVPAKQVNSSVSEINVGGGAVGTFQADPAGSSSGSITSVADAISTTGVLNPAPQGVYQTDRLGSDFTYTVSNLTLTHASLLRSSQ